jgi:hypothetical protein
MLDKFIKENWKYIPYKRNDKTHFNSEVVKKLEEKLNSNGIITEIVKNKMLYFETELARGKSRGSITNSELYIAHALMYSNGTQINLELFQNVRVWPQDPFFGREIERGHPKLQLNYFSSADKKDIDFIHKCLKTERFEEYKKESKD